MGASNFIVFPFYKKEISPIITPTAMLGFTDNNLFQGDLYDKKFNNWEINSEWKLNKTYSTIICTRSAYFSKNPEDFIIRCYNSLDRGGRLYVDWGLGDHWRFPMFKLGWVKNGEHEFAYGSNNFLWSFVWDDTYLEDEQFKVFSKEVEKFGYTNIKKSVFEEVPNIMSLDFVRKYFSLDYKVLTVIKPFLHMYVLIRGVKKEII